MLNHGVADDNVHYQHSMLLTKELEQHDVQFVQHSYADENHSLRGVSRFPYHAMDNGYLLGRLFYYQGLLNEYSSYRISIQNCIIYFLSQCFCN